MLRRTLALAAAAVLALAGSARAADTAKVAHGALHGAVVGKVASFKGISFAAPPVGELRWRPPQPSAAGRLDRGA